MHSETFFQKKTNKRAGHTPVIPGTREAEVGGVQAKATKAVSMRPCLKNKLKAKGLGTYSNGRALA
jgi:hypothetical protein